MDYVCLYSKLTDLAAREVCRLRRSSLIFLVSLIVLSVFLLFLNSGSLVIRFAGLLIIWLAAVPAFIHLQKIDQSPIPLLPFTGLFYVCFFALPLFAIPLGYHVGDKAVIYNQIILDGMQPVVAILVAGGIGAMVTVYYLSKFTFMKKWRPIRISQAELDPPVLQILYWLLIVASLCFRYSPTLQSVPSIGQFLDPVGYLGIGGIFLQWRAGHLPGWQKALTILILLPLEARWRFLEFDLYVLIMIMVFLVFILWRNGQFRVIQAFAVVGMFVVIGYNVTLPMRSHAGTETVMGKAAIYGKYAAELTQVEQGSTVKLDGRDTVVSYDRRISHLVHRLGQIWIFQHVYNLSPQKVPFWEGISYRSLLTSFIPRIIYPNKPKEKIGAKFGYEFGMTNIKNGKTSFNLPWITELLVNFGPIGVIFGMAIFGLFFAGLDRLFNAYYMGEVEFLVGLTIIFRLWHQESNFSVMTGSLLPLFICLYIYFRFGGNLMTRLMVWLRSKRKSPELIP